MIISHNEHSFCVKADTLRHVLLISNTLNMLPTCGVVMDLSSVDVSHVSGNVNLVVTIDGDSGRLHLLSFEDGLKTEGLVTLSAPWVDGDHLALVGITHEDEVLAGDADELWFHVDLDDAFNFSVDWAVDADQLTSEVTYK